jgi:hypothetical protein
MPRGLEALREESGLDAIAGPGVWRIREEEKADRGLP